jgi:L-fucose isomerase-like protein
MVAIEVQSFLGRARDFQKGMETLIREGVFLLSDEIATFKHSPALLGIHCAISYSDALRTGMGRGRVSFDDHSKAADDLESLLKSRNFENRKGIGHFRKLLGKKGETTYGRVAVREGEIEEIVKHAERFANWAETTGKKLKIEGW